MLEHLPAWLGRALRDRRAGHDRLVIADPALRADEGAIALTSPAFADGATLPVRFTADGAGVSPPLAWEGVPAGTAALALIVEDPDAPSPHPLVHAIVWAMPVDTHGLPEGALDAGGGAVGRNSYLRTGWLAPDPPTGHGVHDYVFQLFALSDAPDPGATPGRGAVVEALAGRVIASGLLTGTYERRGPDAVVPATAGLQSG